MDFRKTEKYNRIYKAIDELYNKKLLSLPKACMRLGISQKTYYNACSHLGYDSIANKKQPNKTELDINQTKRKFLSDDDIKLKSNKIKNKNKPVKIISDNESEDDFIADMRHHKINKYRGGSLYNSENHISKDKSEYLKQLADIMRTNKKNDNEISFEDAISEKVFRKIQRQLINKCYNGSENL